MRRAAMVFPASAIVLAIILLVSCGGRPERVGYYFYEIICPGCEESKRMAEYGGTLTAWATSEKHVTIRALDVLHTEDGFDMLGALCEEYEVDLRSLSLPVFFLDGEVHRGFDEIREFLDSVKK